MTISTPHTTEATTAWLNSLTVADLESDTYPIFERLRAEAPIAFIPAIGSWVVSTWELCSQLAEDADNFAGGTSPAHERVFGTGHILGADGLEHQELRASIDPALRPRAFKARLEDKVRPAARERVERIKDRGQADLMADYFEPISVRCVGDILGFTEIDDDTLRGWFHGMSTGIANGAAVDAEGRFLNPDGFAAADEAKAEIRTVVETLAARPADAPAESVVSHWMHDGMEPGQARDIEGLFPSLHVLLLGGLQEPAHACGSTFLGLTTQPEQLARVSSDHSLIPRAISEGLRWISPVFSGTSRLPTKTVDVRGSTLHAGQTVWLSYGSANRDAAEFEHAERYDLDRATHPHLAFGRGGHACSGAAFAPQVARIALEELFTGIPDVQLDPDRAVDVWGWIFRGARELNAVW